MLLLMSTGSQIHQELSRDSALLKDPNKTVDSRPRLTLFSQIIGATTEREIHSMPHRFLDSIKSRLVTQHMRKTDVLDLQQDIRLQKLD